MSELINKLIPIIIIVAAVILVLMVIMSWWKRVPQDKAGVVTGIKKKVITGGGGIVIPVINRIDYISLTVRSSPTPFRKRRPPSFPPWVSRSCPSRSRM